MPYCWRMTDGARLTLLLVDDEPLIIDVCGAVLRSSGYNVIAAGNAKLGLSLFREHSHSIDLVISDLFMPGSGGSEMVSEMTLENSAVKFIFMSGYGAGKVIPFNLEPAFHLITKPFTSDQLLQAVRIALVQRVSISSSSSR